jgi:hypothetical protein
VYDVTKYLDLHPGGAKLIVRSAGADCTGDFEAMYHSGSLDSFNPPHDPFLQLTLTSLSFCLNPSQGQENSRRIPRG